jgi:hypothetical protein
VFATLVGVLLVLWALGLVTSYVLGGFIYALLILTMVVLLIDVVQSRKVA